MVTGLLVYSFLYQKRRISRVEQDRKTKDRFRAEFMCDPIVRPSSKQDTSTTNRQETVVTPTKDSVSKPVIKITPSEYCQKLITDIVATALKGEIRSKQYIYRQLEANINDGTGEIFERCLSDRLNTTQSELDNTTNSPKLFERETPELKRSRLSRTLKALQSIQTEWERFQTQKRNKAAVTAAAQRIVTASGVYRFSALLEIIDPNQNQVFSQSQLQELAQELTQAADSSDDSSTKQEIQQLAIGITRGMTSYEQLESSLVSWIYQSTQVPIGLRESAPTQEPWATWAMQTTSPLPQLLFYVLASNASAIEVVLRQSYIYIGDWVELAVVLQRMQRGLVNWFEKQPYDSKWGKSAAIGTFLNFAIVWCELSNGFHTASHIERTTAEQLAKVCFQIVLQTLRNFAHREYFPLYGGVFAVFGRDSLRDAVTYFDKPLLEVEGTQEKARILTLLGYSQRILGKYEQADSFHQEALEIARQAGDQSCEIANLNHKSHICIAQKDYSQAINYSQRALILARQTGDRIGEAEAVATLGCSEVFAAQRIERIESDTYQTAIEYLQRGLQLSERLADSPFGNSLTSLQTQALCYTSLGIAYIALQKPQAAVDFLEKGKQAANFSGDKYLQGLNFLYLAESYYNLNNLEQAISHSSLGMYLLNEINAIEWRQAAGLLTILHGRIGDETVRQIIANDRNNIIKYIGVDGYDYLPELLKKYKDSQ
ncbi:tetratricopeptide repeat protein [Aetokthonos hydrillicola]|uniref:tetratricopeptide repeat protein n=1 Tax=Aetokthonos hydrillicola TaxID=1550245 RepID=UPI001FBA4DE1